MSGGTIALFLLLLALALSSSSAASNVMSSRRPDDMMMRSINQFLGPQNAARAAVGLKPLVWDPTLASYAQGYANQRRWDCALQHSNGPYGENIFWGSGGGWTPAQCSSPPKLGQTMPIFVAEGSGMRRNCEGYSKDFWAESGRFWITFVGCIASIQEAQKHGLEGRRRT